MSQIDEIEKQLIEAQQRVDKKYSEYEKLRKSKLVLVVFIVLLGPIFQYIPLRSGSLIENYGYPNGLIYYYIGCALVMPIVYLLTLDKMNKEINRMEMDIDLLKRRRAVLDENEELK